jgi:hypothetical protein
MIPILKEETTAKYLLMSTEQLSTIKNKEIIGGVLIFKDVLQKSGISSAEKLKKIKDYKYALDESSIVVTSEKELSLM